jgi:hypothetical protein
MINRLDFQETLIAITGEMIVTIGVMTATTGEMIVTIDMGTACILSGLVMEFKVDSVMPHGPSLNDAMDISDVELKRVITSVGTLW